MGTDGEDTTKVFTITHILKMEGKISKKKKKNSLRTRRIKKVVFTLGSIHIHKFIN